MKCPFGLVFVNRKNEEGAKFIDESMSDIDAGKKYYFLNSALYQFLYPFSRVGVRVVFEALCLSVCWHVWDLSG